MRLSIIMPVYNECETLREILRQVRAVDLPDMEKEILVVDDGSSDGSREILAEEAEVGDLLTYFHEQNRGKGAAVRTRWPSHQAFPGHHCPQRHPRRNALGDASDVWDDTPVLNGEHLARTSHAGLDFIINQQDAIRIGQLAQPLVI